MATTLPAGEKTVHVSDLNHVIGLLGHELGVIVTVEGVAEDGSATGRKEDDGVLLLRVERVNGKPLANPVYFPFQSHTLKKPAVGSKFQYVCYETGSFAGVPADAFQYIEAVATTEFHFRSELVLLKEGSLVSK